MSKILELLSPARNTETGIAAIQYGADAVYIGASKFGARIKASNQIGEIEKLCRYAHLFNAKVYATVNTIIYENELEEARELVWNLHDAGVDAIIIQDTAFLMMDLPPILIFASTQMHNYDVERIKFFDNIGISRFILARELSLEQIKSIKNSVKAELEFFVHGALCVSFSGRCYASAHSTGYSGNRGECKQLCRMKYDLLDNKGNIVIKQKHLLSLKDLNLSDYLEKLIDAGISSFKIEGRLKDINYVKNITAYYRKKIDEIIEKKAGLSKSSNGKIYFAFSPNPERSFNRGFTTYFIDKPDKRMANFYSPKSLGQYIGIVKNISKNKIYIETNEKISTADGLCFVDGNEMVGFLVNKVENGWITPNKSIKITIGTKIFRNQDYEFEKLLVNDKTERKLDIEIDIDNENEKVKFMAKYENIIVDELIECVKSENTEQTSLLEKQLRKTKNTIFEVKRINYNLKNPIFLRMSEINKIRRILLNKLENAILQNYKREKSNIILGKLKFPCNELDYKENISNSLAKKFYLIHGATVKENAFELLKNSENKILMTSKYCILRELGRCLKDNRNIKDRETIYFLQNKYIKYRIEFDCKSCSMNLFSTD